MSHAPGAREDYLHRLEELLPARDAAAVRADIDALIDSARWPWSKALKVPAAMSLATARKGIDSWSKSWM